MVESDPADDNYKILKKNLELLQNYKDASGERLNIVPIEMPKTVVLGEGESRLPASYANFYIGNSVVLLPIFGDKKKDQRAIATLSDLFPERKVVPIECTALVGGFGGIHCVTQQQPALL
jgi:agmatine deiminase